MANYTATIGGTTVNVISGSLHVEQNLGTRSTGGMSVWSSLGTTWNYGTKVQVFDDTGALAYAGYVSKDKVYKSGSRLGQGQLEHDIQLMDNVYKADKRRAFGQFLNVSAGTIVKSFVSSILAKEGVTFTASSIAAGTTIVEAVWIYSKSCSEAINWLAQQSGYWWQIDINNVLWFQPYGGVAAPFVLDGTQVDSLQQLYVEYGNDMYVNSQYVKGSFQETGVLTETLIGNSQSRSFTLSYPISSIKQVLFDGGNITAQMGTKDQIGSAAFPFYYATGDAVIAQDPSGTILTSSDTLKVTYKGRIPTIARAQNAALITAQKAREGGGSGLVESSYNNTKVKTQAAAFQIAGALLSHYGQDTTLLNFATRTKGLAPGQMLTVKLADYGLASRQMLISQVQISDQVDGFNIWFIVQAVGSPVESAQWQTYWANLMGQTYDTTDLTDTADGAALSFLSSTVLTRSPTFVVHPTKTTCPIFNTGTLFNNTTIFC